MSSKLACLAIAAQAAAVSTSSVASFLQRSAALNREVAVKIEDISAPPTPTGISPLDLWAIHDLLLVGHSAPLLQEPGATPGEGTPVVQAAVASFAGMLHHIHPVPACRAAVGNASTIAGKAEASWTCLGLTVKNFSGAIKQEAGQFEPDNTEPNFNLLGACSGSKWPRACSYWASMHAMGLRADMLQKGDEFFHSMLRIIAGGALYCFGCTSHFVILNRWLLPAELQNPDKIRQY